MDWTMVKGVNSKSRANDSYCILYKIPKFWFTFDENQKDTPVHFSLTLHSHAAVFSSVAASLILDGFKSLKLIPLDSYHRILNETKF